MSVLQQTVSLAAQPRAFSSLLSLPSQAQSVIKAFRRQGIGSADIVNTARFFLSRLESLSAAPTSLSFLRFRSKSSKSSEGGQMSCLLSSELSAAAIASAHISAQPRQARLCDLFRSACAPLHKSHRLAKARIKIVAFVFLSVGLCQSRKDPCLPLDPQCVRLLPRPTGLPPMAFAVSFRIRFADAKTAVKHHRPTHFLPLEHHLICILISRPKGIPWVYIFFRDGPYQVLLCYLCA